jgi:cell division FtsZ-interacting protein ZapD
MIGTVNQIAWAVRIRMQVDAEFDRVRKVLESVATKQSADDGTHLQAIIRILEDKRAEVMGNEQAGYFIHDWQELRDQVRQLIIGDPGYMAIKANQAVRVMARRSNGDSKDPVR